MNEKMIHRCVDGLGNKRIKEDISDWVKCGFQFCPWCGMVLNPSEGHEEYDCPDCKGTGKVVDDGKKMKKKDKPEGYAEICERCESRKNGDPDCISCDIPRMISGPPINESNKKEPTLDDLFPGGVAFLKGGTIE